MVDGGNNIKLATWAVVSGIMGTVRDILFIFGENKIYRRK